MSNENYVNYYVEILSSTMTDAIVRNVSLQANAKVTNEIIEAQAKELEELRNQIENSSNNMNSQIGQLQEEIKNKHQHIEGLNKQINDFSSLKTEYENVKHQVNHIDTFRNELIKERDLHQKTREDYEKQIAVLNKKIEKLKPSPVKKVKVEEANTLFTESTEPETIIKDGGSF
jgi:chromosome segregation ATPase